MKKSLILIGIMSIFIAIIWFVSYRYLESDFDILQKNRIYNHYLVNDSHVSITLEEGTKLHFVSDSIDNIYYFLLADKKIISLGIICNLQTIKNDTETKDVYWTAFEKPGRYTIFTGLISNNNIRKLSVNFLEDEEIYYLDFRDHTLFYSNQRLESPILIRGFSASNELIYKNYQD